MKISCKLLDGSPFDVEVESTDRISELKKKIKKEKEPKLDHLDADKLFLVRVFKRGKPTTGVKDSTKTEDALKSIASDVKATECPEETDYEGTETPGTPEFLELPGWQFEEDGVAISAKVMNPAGTCEKYGLNQSSELFTVDVLVILPVDSGKPSTERVSNKRLAASNLTFVQRKRKKFSVDSLDPERNYLVKLGYLPESAVTPFYDLVDSLDTNYVLLYGHRQSGKTSTLYICQDELVKKGDVDAIVISLENVMMDSVYSFFSSLYEIVESTLKGMMGSVPYPIPDINPAHDSKTRYMSLFLKTNQNNRDLILMVDEGDVLLENPHVGAHFLHAMREIKHSVTTYRLRGFLLVGVESILECRNNFGDAAFSSAISPPFSMKYVVSPMRFNEENIAELLNMYVHERRYSDADVQGIANDIYERTLGHRGITGVCLAEIENMLKFPSLREWKIFAVETLGSVLISRSHYRKITRSIPELEGEQKSIFDQIMRDGRATLSNKTDAVNQLLTKGIIIESRLIDLLANDCYEISSPLLRQAILQDFTREVKFGDDVPPEIPSLKWLVRCCIQNLQKENLTAREVQNASSHYTSEYAFQAEFVCLLQDIFRKAYSSLRYKVLFEVKERDENGNRRKRLDILLHNGTLPKFGVELLVSNRRESLDDHILRAIEYKNLHNCEEVVVVRFWNQQSDLSEIFQTGDNGVSVVHVVLDNNFTSALLTYENEFVELKLLKSM